MTILAIDISHYQGTPNFAAVHGANVGLVFLKATEGTSYTDPTFAANRASARAAGLTTGFYHFARAGDAVAEANHFCNVVGHLDHGDILALDWEVPSSNPPAWSLSFLKQVEARFGVKPLIYMNQSTANGYNWNSVVSNDNGLWLAKYDFDPNAVPTTKYWSTVAVKQYSDRGTVAGVAGQLDLDVFEGDAAQLAKYGFGGGSPTPVPAPPVPPAPPTPPPGRVQIATYTVRAGDNLTDIAKRFPEADVTAGSIAADNGITDPNHIQVGQVLRILSGHAPAPTPVPAPVVNGEGSSLPTMAYGQTSAHIKNLQAFLNRYNWVPALPLIQTTGYFGDLTAHVLHLAGQQLGVQGDADGRNFGPHFKDAFWHIGFRG